MAGGGPPRARGARGRAGDRRERAERPAGDARPSRRAAGDATRPGPTTSPRAASAGHRRARGLLRGVRHGRPPGQGVAPPPRPRRRSTRRFRRRRFGAPADDVPPARFVVFDQNHDQVGNRALGDRLPAPARPLAAFCTLLSPFVPLLFMGEEYGEDAPFQFFTDHIDPEIADATREGRRRSSRRSRRSPRRRSPTRRTRRRSSAPSSRARRDPELADLYARAARGPPAPAAGRCRRDRVRRGGALAACAPRALRGDRELQLRAALRAVPGCHGGARHARRADDRGRDGRARADVGSAGRLSEIEAWPGRPFPLGATWDGGGTNFSLFSEHASGVSSACSTTRTTRLASR